MNKAFEKILEFIKQNTIQNKDSLSFFNECGVKFISAGKAKEIVQEVAEDYKGGWIPCEKRLPDEAQKFYLITYRKVFFGEFYYFTDITYLSTLSNGNKSWEIEEADKMKKVIAWQPIPEPYQQKGE